MDESLYNIEIEEECDFIEQNDYDEDAEASDSLYYVTEDDNETEYDINHVNDEVASNLEGFKPLQFDINTNEDESNLNETNIDFAYQEHYLRQPFEKLMINFGSSEIPRFSCANHNLNLAVRAAIAIDIEFTQMLKDLNKANAHVRRSITLNNAFKTQKCKLRLENLTRWSSAYLMLLSVSKAFKKNLFNEANQCPVDIQIVEIYLGILEPAYVLSQQFQFNHSSIADVIPSIKRLIYTFKQMDPPESQKKLCKYLVTSVLEKFNYELNSNVYKVKNLIIIFKIFLSFFQYLKRWRRY